MRLYHSQRHSQSAQTASCTVHRVNKAAPFVVQCVNEAASFAVHCVKTSSLVHGERWGAGVETQKNVRGEIGGWGRVPSNEPCATGRRVHEIS